MCNTCIVWNACNDRVCVCMCACIFYHSAVLGFVLSADGLDVSLPQTFLTSTKLWRSPAWKTLFDVMVVLSPAQKTE